VTLVAAPRCCRGAHITVGGHHTFNRHVEVPPPLTVASLSVPPPGASTDAGPSGPPASATITAGQPQQLAPQTSPHPHPGGQRGPRDAHGWTIVVQVSVVECTLPLDVSSPLATGAVVAPPAEEPVEIQMDSTWAPSPVAGRRRRQDPPLFGPPQRSVDSQPHPSPTRALAPTPAPRLHLLAPPPLAVVMSSQPAITTSPTASGPHSLLSDIEA
jgi:hypothetical protein